MLPLCYFPICVSIFFLDIIYFHVAFLWFSYLCYFFSTVIRFRYVGNSYISGYLSVWIVKKSEQFLDKELHNITLRLPIAEFPGWLTEPVKKLPVRQLLVWKPWSSCLFFSCLRMCICSLQVVFKVRKDIIVYPSCQLKRVYNTDSVTKSCQNVNTISSHK